MEKRKRKKKKGGVDGEVVTNSLMALTVLRLFLHKCHVFPAAFFHTVYFVFARELPV